MMIEVNLLPVELRRVEHTPLPRFLVVIIGTAAIMATGAFGVVVNWRRVPDLRAREMVLDADVGRSTVQAAVYDRLLGEIEETKDRKTAIGEMWRARILWSEKLAQLAEMTPNFIGIQDITVSEPREGGRANKDESGGMLAIGSICAGADHKRVANWRRIVKGEYRVEGSSDPWVGQQFFRSFVDLLPTSTQKVEVKDYVEKEALKFGLKMPVKAASVRLAEAVAAAREARSGHVTPAVVPVTLKSGTPTEAPAPSGESPKVETTPVTPGVKEGVPEVEPAAPAAENPAPPTAPADEGKKDTTPEKTPTPQTTKPEGNTSVVNEENEDT